MMFCLGLLDESLMCSLSNFSHCIDLSAWSIRLEKLTVRCRRLLFCIFRTSVLKVRVSCAPHR